MRFRFGSAFGTAAAIVLLIVGFVFSWQFFGKMDPYSTLVPSDEQLPITLNDVELHTRDNGILTGEIHASSLTISPARDTISAMNLSRGVFYRNGKPTLYFSAARAAYSAARFYSSSKVTIDGGIQLSTPSTSLLPVNVRVSTRTVEWNSSTSVVTCPYQVKFESTGLFSGSASGFSLNTVNNNINIESVNASQPVSLVDDPVAAQPASQNTDTPTAPGQVPQSNVLTYTAQDCHWDAQERLLTIKGAVTFHQGKSNVEMVGATYDRQTDTAKSASPIKITDPDTTVTGDSGTINFSTHVAILQGNIKMVIIPTAKDKVSEPEAEKPTTILCDQINYNYRQKKAHTIGKVVIQQPSTGRTVTSDTGEYDAVLKTVDLVGHVIGKSTDGKIIKAPHAKLSVDPGNEWLQLDGPITGTMPVDDADNPTPPQTAPKQVPATPAAQPSKEPTTVGDAPK